MFFLVYRGEEFLDDKANTNSLTLNETNLLNIKFVSCSLKRKTENLTTIIIITIYIDLLKR